MYFIVFIFESRVHWANYFKSLHITHLTQMGVVNNLDA